MSVPQAITAYFQGVTVKFPRAVKQRLRGREHEQHDSQVLNEFLQSLGMVRARDISDTNC